MRAGPRVHASSSVGQVGLDEGQHRLGLRDRRSGTLNSIESRTVGGQHQPGVEHADVRRAGGGEVVEHRLHERGDQFVGRVRDRRRGVGAHAAGVGAGVALADALVVLGDRQGERRRAVAQRHQRALRAVQRSSSRNGPVGGRGVDRVVRWPRRRRARRRPCRRRARRASTTTGTPSCAPPCDGGVGVRRSWAKRGPGMPSSVASVRAYDFDDSSRASSAVGPKHGMPAAAHSSAMPAASAASGPGMTRSTSAGPARRRGPAATTHVVAVAATRPGDAPLRGRRQPTTSTRISGAPARFVRDGSGMNGGHASTPSNDSFAWASPTASGYRPVKQALQ